ncbi:MAG: TIR domain-containing protein [Acidobacteria bacterium]|nr:MAG: TIR domain-containing protein [Acidobacteriota bacterium]
MPPDDSLSRFHVFVSFKNLDSKGLPTRDASLAKEVYDYLTSRDLEVFLSNVTLEKLGVSEYMKAIDRALASADVLVAVGTSADNLDSQWVRYEWGSFFNDILSGRKKSGRIYSYLDNVPIHALPRPLQQNQVFQHSEAGMNTLGNFILNALGLPAPGGPSPSPASAGVQHVFSNASTRLTSLPEKNRSYLYVLHAAHGSVEDFKEIEPAFLQALEVAAVNAMPVTVLYEYGGSIGDGVTLNESMLETEKSLLAKALSATANGQAPLFILGKDPTKIPGHRFFVTLLEFLAYHRLHTVPENLSYTAWTLAEQADGAHGQLNSVVRGNAVDRIIEAQIGWLSANMRALEQRDREFADQLAKMLADSRPTIFVTVRGAAHLNTITSSLKRLRVPFDAVVPEGCSYPPREQVLQELLAAGCRPDSFTLSDRQRTLLLEDFIAHNLGEILEKALASPYGSHLGRMSTFQKTRLTNAVFQRWTDVDVQAIYAKTGQARGKFVLDWLTEKGTDEDIDIFIRSFMP